MSVARRPILSHPDPARPEPWVDFDLDIEAMTATIREVTGPTAAGLCDAAQERALVGSWTLGLDPDAPLGIHTLAITLEGALVFVPLSKQPPILYAHLAWVNPATGLADALEFVDGRILVEDDQP